jgi:hypothetical protein
MNITKDQTKDSIELVLCTLIIIVIIGFISHTDSTILAKRQSFQILSNAFLPQGQPFLTDEIRISNLFVEDTLPRLIRSGIVKKYELTHRRTLLFVNGKLWKQRSQFFKNCLLKEILAHNTVNGYSPETRIIDNQSRKLFAKISPSFSFTFFD